MDENIKAIYRSAKQAIEDNGLNANIVVSMLGRWGKRDTRKLNGHNGPVGHIVEEKANVFYSPSNSPSAKEYRVLVVFKASEIISWVEKCINMENSNKE